MGAWLMIVLRPPALATLARATLVAWLLLLASAVPGAISTDGEKTNALAGRALLCFYRDSEFGKSERSYAIGVGSENLGRLSEGTYLYYLVRPGRRRAWIEGEVRVSRTFVVREGGTYFVRVQQRRDAFFSMPRFTIVGEKEAVAIRGMIYAGLRVGDPLIPLCRTRAAFGKEVE